MTTKEKERKMALRNRVILQGGFLAKVQTWLDKEFANGPQGYASDDSVGYTIQELFETTASFPDWTDKERQQTFLLELECVIKKLENLRHSWDT